ncbi:MAG: xanthine dehydrogenase family protein [Thermoleophilaceae bacterium]|nr:xanthine dehydrogenase family protein [Thermoleophilaceae bacterium]
MPRREDAELLTGRGRFIGDLQRPGMLHAAFLRSPYPHARIESIDSSAATAMPGVHAVLTGADLPEDLGAQPNTHLFGERETPYYALARERVRYAGEPVAVIVAESPYVAEDARDEIVVDWEPLPSVGDAELAVADGAPLVWPDRDWPDNVCGTFETEMGNVDQAFDEADVVVTESYRIQRQFACSLEGRGVLAEWDQNVDELTIWTSSQIVHIVRDLLSAVLGLPEHRIRVLVPRIGGGFGAKFHFYPEETAVALAARATGRPVRWVEDRLESFLATVHAREQRVRISMAARDDGTIIGVKGDLIGDMGAAMHTVGYGPLWLTAVMLTSVYEIPSARVRARAVVTNKTPLGSYRGWGQPQANFVVERTVDRLAEELGIERVELRRRNFIPPERLPRKSLHHTLDSGDYRACLDRAMELVAERRWYERQAELREQGRHVGIGISFYTENSALGPSRMINEGGVQQGGYDIARVRVEPGGEVTLYTGLCEMGQGLTTALAQVCADNLGVHPDQINVVHGDSSQVPYTGYGTGASRGAAVGGAAVMKAAGSAREKVLRIAGHMLEANPADLEAEDGRIFVRGTPSASVTMADVGRAAYIRAIELPDGEDPGIEAVEAFDPPQFAWPYGANVAVVEVDVETGEVSFLDYLYVHDCGTIVNPAIVEGQIQGGVAQGIGAALFEALPYDEEGQPLFATFMEYVLPTAAELPRLVMEHQHTPSPNIPGGMKGVGEAGAIGSPAAVVAAIEDALAPYGARITETPVTPAAIVAMVARAGVASV